MHSVFPLPGHMPRTAEHDTQDEFLGRRLLVYAAALEIIRLTWKIG